MKRLFILGVLALSFSALFAQQTTVALLNHEGTISTFYGSEALVQAHKAAAHGDVITLSGGAFTAPSSWTKAVTLRGAGCYAGADNSREVTYIGNEFKLAIPVEIETTMTIEGINFKSTFNFNTKVRNTAFLKCYFYQMASVCRNTNFYNCVISENMEISASANDLADINFVNCYVKDYRNTSSYASIKLTNCVVYFSNFARNFSSGGSMDRNSSLSQYATYRNCIFLGNRTISNSSVRMDYNIHATCTATHCLSCYCMYTPAVDTDVETKDAIYDYNIFDNMGNNTNKYLDNEPIVEAIKSVFKTYNGTNGFSFNEFYELTDEAKAMYIGSDGTQIGLHGGIGFSLIPSTLQITKCEVAPRSTTDGKLSVKIEVGIPE